VDVALKRITLLQQHERFSHDIRLGRILTRGKHVGYKALDVDGKGTGHNKALKRLPGSLLPKRSLVHLIGRLGD